LPSCGVFRSVEESRPASVLGGRTCVGVFRSDQQRRSVSAVLATVAILDMAGHLRSGDVTVLRLSAKCFFRRWATTGFSPMRDGDELRLFLLSAGVCCSFLPLRHILSAPAVEPL
jgi:hypothetical protein